jgi:quercetin dioxygenase-like cupin family protein
MVEFPAIGPQPEEEFVNFNKRDLSLLFLAFAISSALGQDRPSASNTYRYEDLKVNTNGENRSRPILNEKLHSGFGIELHETELAPGLAPHPPHRHDHEEMILIREGTLEVTIQGRSVNLGPGSVALVASNEEHGWRNVGTTRARYFVIALGRPVPERK